MALISLTLSRLSGRVEGRFVGGKGFGGGLGLGGAGGQDEQHQQYVPLHGCRWGRVGVEVWRYGREWALFGCVASMSKRVVREEKLVRRAALGGIEPQQQEAVARRAVEITREGCWFSGMFEEIVAGRLPS